MYKLKFGISNHTILHVEILVFLSTFEKLFLLFFPYMFAVDNLVKDYVTEARYVYFRALYSIP